MTDLSHPLADLEDKASQGGTFSAEDVARLLACPDLVAVGIVGDTVRRRASGDTITFGRVCEVRGDADLYDRGEATEVRVGGGAESFAQAAACVKRLASSAAGATLTAYSAADLLAWSGGDHLGLADGARMLRAAGLAAVAEVPIDRLGSLENAVEIVRAIVHGGLGAWRVTVHEAAIGRRVEAIEHVVVLQQETGAVRAFAPLPRIDASNAPSTGYDDVRTIAAARVRCSAVPFIQVDWPLYGPKLAQVALTYGANDVDGISASDASPLGPRRAPREEILRQIRATGGTPVERDGRYQPRS